MKKVLFFVLFLVFWGTAGVNAQVRIGGNGQPNGAAVLDLNTTDEVTGTKGLALPRVTLGSATTQLTTGITNLNGMLVYNTGGSLGSGIYYWDGSQWQAILNSSGAKRGQVKWFDGSKWVDTTLIQLHIYNVVKGDSLNLNQWYSRKISDITSGWVTGLPDAFSTLCVHIIRSNLRNWEVSMTYDSLFYRRVAPANNQFIQLQCQRFLY